jgi:hypothetical protein
VIDTSRAIPFARSSIRDAQKFDEYAVGTLAAVAFAGLLLKVLTSAQVQAALGHLIERALK